ncbi:hypothetical protein [Croceicoccus hydrothermalis]|uniref:hypothetical protein n=1 Tax=Croceicoccus hydrothermalis TaxID=2867964 RepID=UPI001EFAFCBA|nr:hypothetical protein [Croceicoccus hydrothermalis]
MSQNELLNEFRKSYDRLLKARETGCDRTAGHAERNFYACAEIVASRLPAPHTVFATSEHVLQDQAA